MADNPVILICDDDELVVELIQFRLEAKGYSVVVASDGEAALAETAANKPSLIVLDAMMPKLDGFQTLARLKQDPEHQRIPVIMLTARKGEQDILKALETGAEDYLVKPFIPDELIARMTRILARA